MRVPVMRASPPQTPGVLDTRLLAMACIDRSLQRKGEIATACRFRMLGRSYAIVAVHGVTQQHQSCRRGRESQVLRAPEKWTQGCRRSREKGLL